MIHLKTPSEIEILRECNLIVYEILNTLKGNCQAGVTTLELDRIAEDLTRKKKGQPAFKGYNGFPATLCISVNEEVVHGIPSKRILRDGDIVSIDYGICFRGYYGDAAITVPVGAITEDLKFLLETTEECLMLGIGQALPGNHLADISAAIQTHAETARVFLGQRVLRAWCRQKSSRRAGSFKLCRQRTGNCPQARLGVGDRTDGQSRDG